MVADEPVETSKFSFAGTPNNNGMDQPRADNLSSAVRPGLRDGKRFGEVGAYIRIITGKQQMMLRLLEGIEMLEWKVGMDGMHKLLLVDLEEKNRQILVLMNCRHGPVSSPVGGPVLSTESRLSGMVDEILQLCMPACSDIEEMLLVAMLEGPVPLDTAHLVERSTEKVGVHPPDPLLQADFHPLLLRKPGFAGITGRGVGAKSEKTHRTMAWCDHSLAESDQVEEGQLGIITEFHRIFVTPAEGTAHDSLAAVVSDEAEGEIEGFGGKLLDIVIRGEFVQDK